MAGKIGKSNDKKLLFMNECQVVITDFLSHNFDSQNYEIKSQMTVITEMAEET